MGTGCLNFGEGLWRGQHKIHTVAIYAQQATVLRQTCATVDSWHLPTRWIGEAIGQMRDEGMCRANTIFNELLQTLVCTQADHMLP